MDWRRTKVSSDGTHHTLDGEPLYAARFRDVLKYHAPGLAPALGEDGATHIDLSGVPAYAERHARTFGFYEGLAAVDSGTGWFHIHPDGRRAYAASWAWCGNFQGGRCAVRQEDGGYLHIDPAGAPLSARTWRYAGDFRDGVGVVQGDDGLHTHVDLRGELLHGRWFVDLDVFHKGFARARDDRGWTHVGTDGVAAYARRFATVEPFYNGQARVERFDGGLEVIDESGRTVTELRQARRSEFAALSRDLVGFWKTRAIGVGVRFGVFDALPTSSAAVAVSAGLSLEGAERLLLALSELGLVARGGDSWFLTARGAYLRREHPWTLADAALEYDGPMGDLWRRLPEALVAGDDWTGPDIFGEVAAEATRVEPHHRMLRSYARHDYAAVADALELRGDERVVDAGGGLGVLTGLLTEAHLEVEVVLLDRPEVLELVPDLPRVQRHAADLFGQWDVEADVVLLARVLHDWSDERAVEILRAAREALRPGGRLFVLEMLRSPDGVEGALCDLHLMVATGGRERTLDEFAGLLGAAGFGLDRVQRLPSIVSVLEGRPR